MVVGVAEGGAVAWAVVREVFAIRLLCVLS